MGNRLKAGLMTTVAGMVLAGCVPVYGSYYDTGYSAPPPAQTAPVWADQMGIDDYAWIDRAEVLSETIGDSPPDFAFDIEGEDDPWAWSLEDGSLVIVEQRPDGPWSYYFDPGQRSPFFVRGPAVSFGFVVGKVATIHEADGGVMTRLDGDPWLMTAGDASYRGELLFRAWQRRGEYPRQVSVATWIDFTPYLYDWNYDWEQGRRRHERWRARKELRGDMIRAIIEKKRREETSDRFRRWREGGWQGPPPGRWQRPPEGWRPRPTGGPGQPGAGNGGPRPGGPVVRPGGPGRPDRPGGPGRGPRPDGSRPGADVPALPIPETVLIPPVDQPAAGGVNAQPVPPRTRPERPGFQGGPRPERPDFQGRPRPERPVIAVPPPSSDTGVAPPPPPRPPRPFADRPRPSMDRPRPSTDTGVAPPPRPFVDRPRPVMDRPRPNFGDGGRPATSGSPPPRTFSPPPSAPARSFSPPPAPTRSYSPPPPPPPPPAPPPPPPPPAQNTLSTNNEPD